MKNYGNVAGFNLNPSPRDFTPKAFNVQRTPGAQKIIDKMYQKDSFDSSVRVKTPRGFFKPTYTTLT